MADAIGPADGLLMNLRVEPVTRPSPESTDTPLGAAQDGGRLIPPVAKEYVIRFYDVEQLSCFSF